MREFSFEEVEAATGGFAAKNLVGKGSHGNVYVATLKGGGDGGGGGGGGRVKKKIALDVAEAVRALHGGEPRVIHRDVKSANILLGRDGRARLADFSLAVKVPASPGGGGGATAHDDANAGAVGPAPAGTIGYLDPCYTEPGRLGPESDVFSFGVVLLELVSGRKVMDVNASPSSIVAWAVPLVAAGMAREVLDGRVPAPRCAKEERAVARVLAVAARCVSERVERRPAMSDVVAELHGALESAGWPRRPRRRGGDAHGLAGTLYRRVVSWGASRLHVRRRVRTSKIECTEHSGSEGSAQPDHPSSSPRPSHSNNNILT
uniref:non-specific serine/threonine protein kinase n=1 Tax=Oryza punctata TaxID=4537 RepID=A0A0E0JGU3_ORYPU